MASSLETLARLRIMQAKLAEGALSNAYLAEQRAEAAVEAAQGVRLDEAVFVQANTDAKLLGAFAAWLPVTTLEIAQCQITLQEVAAARATASAEAAERKQAVEAIGLVQERLALETAKRSQRRLQNTLDELGCRRHRSRG